MYLYTCIRLRTVVARIGNVDWLWSVVSSVCGLFGSGSFWWGFVRCLCRIMCDGWEGKQRPRLPFLAREAIIIIVFVVIILLIGIGGIGGIGRALILANNFCVLFLQVSQR